MSRRNWVFTSYTEPNRDNFDQAKIKYVVWQKEKAPTTDRIHWQGYVELTATARMKGAAEALGITGAHMEPRAGTRNQAREYCMKEESRVEGPWEYGTWEEVSQGKRTDVEKAKEILVRGGSMREVVQEVSSYQAIKFAEKYHEYTEPKRTWKTQVYWFWGPTGAGKSYTAHQMAPEAYHTTDNLKWWNGYDQHADVIIDDFRPCMVSSFARLLQLFDEYPCKIETKGGMREFLAKRVFITAPDPPVVMFANIEERLRVQLDRRITEVRYFPERVDVTRDEVRGNTKETLTSFDQ